MKRRDAKTQSKRSDWARFILFTLILAGAIWLGGFLSFAQHVDKLKTPKTVVAADGIVVWTGKGGGRLTAGAQLLAAEKGERLLISGVNAQNEIPQIQDLSGLSDTLADCCLDLDYAAKDTIGNARETAAWATALGYDHIILVTSSYHMPRATVEITSAAGRMRITPYPVASSDTRKWYKSSDRAKRLLQEYTKLLLAYARGRRSDVEAPELTGLDAD